MQTLGLVIVLAVAQSHRPLPLRPAVLPADASAPAAKTISVNGTDLTYVEQGVGLPVVFLHGAFSDHRVWEPQREAVAKRYALSPWTSAISARPRGRTLVPSADLAAFIRQLKAGPVHLVGRSYGAGIALATAVQHPELVRGLFLNEPPLPSLVTDPADRQLLVEERKGLAPVTAAVQAENTTEAARQFFDWVNGQPGGFDALPSASRAIHLDNARTVPLQVRAPPNSITCAQLGGLKVPITITRGELTRPYFRVLAEAAARCAAGSQSITIEGARHGAPSQRPEPFNKALLAFLARNR